MPRSRATSTEVSTSAADWSVFKIALRYLVYGNETIRFVGVGVTSSSAVRAVGNQACGLAAATSVKRAISRPTTSMCSDNERPWWARRALSKIG